MMKENLEILLATLLLLTALPARAHEGHKENADTAFAAVFHHYEALWQALAVDDGESVAKHAEGMREAADAIAADFSAEQAGLAKGVDAEKAAKHFDDVAKAALLLGSTTDLAGAREAFYEVSKPLVRLNELLAGERMKVVYCSMAKKSWLQRQEKIANPYFGGAMADCGEVVS